LELCPPPQLEHRLLILLPGHADEDVAGDGRVRAVIVLDRLRQARERQRIAHMRPALVNEIGHLRMRGALRADQSGKSERFFEGRQVLPLQSLDHGYLERMVVPDERRNRPETRNLRRTISPLPGEQQVASVTLALDDYRLQQPADAYRLRELCQALLV